MKIDPTEFLRQMLGILRSHFVENWTEIDSVVRQELEALVLFAQKLEELNSQGKVSESQAKLHLEILLSNIRIALLTVQGLSLIAIENAVNDILSIFQENVQRILGGRFF